MRSSKNKSSKKRSLLIILVCIFILVISLFKIGIISIPNLPFRMINPAVDPNKEMEFKKLLGEYGLMAQNIEYKDTITVIFPDHLMVLFSSKSDLKYSVASLQFIISRSKIEGKIPKSIDLRFDKPVVVY
jgi:hypothetical protein